MNGEVSFKSSLIDQSAFAQGNISLKEVLRSSALKSSEMIV